MGGKAVVTDIVVESVPSQRTHLSFTGECQWNQRSKGHIRRVVFPLAQEIAVQLELPPPRFACSIVNPGRATQSDTGVDVIGFSADLPLLLAMLGELCGLDVPQNVASSGAIASRQGHIRMVKQLPEKLQAAISHPAITKFICPAWEDHSLEVLSPEQSGEVRAAIKASRLSLETRTVSDVSELVAKVFSNESLMAAALKSGYFHYRDKNSIHSVAGLLASGGREEFYRLIEQLLLRRDLVRARELIQQWVRLSFLRKEYPFSIGQRLLGIIHSLPTTTFRLLFESPLIEEKFLQELIRLSNMPEEREALEMLASRPKMAEARGALNDERDDIGEVIETLLDRLDLERIQREILDPIEDAAMRYAQDSPRIRSPAEFGDAISAYVTYLLSQCGMVGGAIPPLGSRSLANAYVERAFAGQGGMHAACQEAMLGINGGLNEVYRRVIETIQEEQLSYHLSGVLAIIFEKRKPEFKREFAQYMMTHYGGYMHSEVKRLTLDELADKCEGLVLAYVQARQALVQTIRKY